LRQLLHLLMPEEPANRESPYRLLLAHFLDALSGVEGSDPPISSILDDPGLAEPELAEAAALVFGAAQTCRRELEALGLTDETALIPTLGTVSGPGANMAAKPAGSLFSGTRLATADVARGLWSLFHPEAAAVAGKEQEAEEQLRRKRTVQIEQLPADPITDAGHDLLFTSNVLLCPPTEAMLSSGLDLDPNLLARIAKIAEQPQEYWYDHPIPVGTKPQNNEILYGLQHLDKAVEFEKARGTCKPGRRVPVVLSVSVTHRGLDGVAREYLEGELRSSGGLRHLDIFVFGEQDARAIVEQVLAPVLWTGMQRSGSERSSMGTESNLEELRQALAVFGADGEYGRHYSFLKAIAPLWQIIKDERIRATFKIDLDQVFPQDELVEETGKSAFQLLASPLWGALGRDDHGNGVELGMIAGALVNEQDIGKGLFTPDVDYPRKPPEGEELVFFSRYPQAMSTRAEMMTRYDGTNGLDGESTCLQRIHVTGGTNGIRTDTLRKFRPFTPSFIGRAEDQAYILSTFQDPQSRTPCLGYLHQPGLIMRHDKASFAAAAIKAAASGKQVGDYVRMILFSAYAAVLPGGVPEVKKRIDPFTGSFVSRLPVTIALLRFMVKAEDINRSSGEGAAREFFVMGARRLRKTIDFVEPTGAMEASGERPFAEDQSAATPSPSPMQRRLERERTGWHYYYESLDILDNDRRNPETAQARIRALELIERCRVQLR